MIIAAVMMGMANTVRNATTVIIQVNTGMRMSVQAELDVFFAHLAARRFPSTCFIRRRDQLDYLQEPDVFHDICGHVPMLMNPIFADYMQAALVCPEVPAEGGIDLPAFHARQSRRYIGAFAVTGVIALAINSYYSDAYNVVEYAKHNVAVIPLIAIAVVAAVWRNRWVQIVCPILLGCIWIYYFFELQSALK